MFLYYKHKHKHKYNNNKMDIIDIKNNRFNLVLCELFNRHIHGSPGDNIKELDGHYLLISKFNGQTKRLFDDGDDFDLDADFTDTDSDTDSDDSGSDLDTEIVLSTINDFTTFYNEYYTDYYENDLEPHIILRNYQNIIARPDYIKPEIAECVILETHHCVAIIKTIWIKLIQRKWKKIYAERKNIIRKRMSQSSLSTRELTGHWPQHCCYLPSIYGMLSNLTK